jgi:hypothetical protein
VPTFRKKCPTLLTSTPRTGELGLARARRKDQTITISQESTAKKEAQFRRAQGGSFYGGKVDQFQSVQTAALALLGQYRFMPGKIDLEIIILMVVSVFILFGVVVWVSTW